MKNKSGLRWWEYLLSGAHDFRGPSKGLGRARGRRLAEAPARKRDKEKVRHSFASL